MSREPPVRFDEAADVRRLLKQLGDGSSPAPSRDASDAAREERIAASLDSGLENLVRQRARTRAWGAGALAIAASALLALGLRGGATTPSLGITREPPRSAPNQPSPPETAPATLPPMAARSSYSSPKRPSTAPRPPNAAPSSAAAAEPDTKSSLAEENRLFTRAVEVGRQGDVDEAVRLLDELLRRHPQSPLAQTAAVRKFRLLQKAGRTEEAQQGAMQYLSTYPTGFAVEEARELGGAAVAAPTSESTQP